MLIAPVEGLLSLPPPPTPGNYCDYVTQVLLQYNILYKVVVEPPPPHRPLKMGLNCLKCGGGRGGGRSQADSGQGIETPEGGKSEGITE